MKPFIILTAWKGHADTTKDIFAMSILDQEASLRGMPTLDVKGCYEGATEPARAFTAHSARDHGHLLAMGLELGALFNQECILEVKANGEAWFHYMSGNSVFQGHWVRVDSSRGLKGFTVFPDGAIYTIKGGV